MILFLSFTIVLISVSLPVWAQSPGKGLLGGPGSPPSLLPDRNPPSLQPEWNYFLHEDTLADTVQTADPTPHLPDPMGVMYKSMIIPGWGQIVNRQIWKVPIVYGLLGGLGYYSVFLTKQYHDYRAAYYNLNPESPDDLRFGPTPAHIPPDANLEQLKFIRNSYRNRRDMVYIGIVLAYGLNIVDAYVFAHMRSFDVSEDLSMRTRLQPGIMGQGAPGFTLSIDLVKKQ